MKSLINNLIDIFMLKTKNEIFILNQPKRLLFTLVVVDLPLTSALDDKIHFNLGWLVDYSDLFFLFPEKHYPEQGGINKRKFTSLYQGCGFTECSDYSISKNIIKTILYDTEILKDTQNHLGVIVVRLSDLINVESHQIKHIQSIISSGITSPIYKERRLSSSEFFDIYSFEGIEFKDYKKLSGHGVFKTIMRALNLKKNLTDDVSMYSTWHSESPIMFFPKSSITSILRYRELNKEGFNEWSETFVNSDPRYFLASLVNTCGLDILNMEIQDVKV